MFFQTNSTFKVLLFFSFYLNVISQRQPIFLSQTAGWDNSKDTPYTAVSPFYQNEKEIVYQILYLVNYGEEEKSLKLLKSIVKTERNWRLRTCNRMFGVKSCHFSASDFAVPFFIWKKKIVNHLLTDPTKEIIERLKSAIKITANQGAEG